jgi:hypothetical protein
MQCHAPGDFSTSFAGLCCPLTVLFHAVNTLNTHEDLQSRLFIWMVAIFAPQIDPDIAKYPKLGLGGNYVNVCIVELMAQCSSYLFQGWNETYLEQMPMGVCC